MSPLNIAMISYYLPSRDKIGSGYQAHYMANALCRRGHRVTMFSPVPRPDDGLYQVQIVPVGASRRIFRFAKNLGRIDWSPFDILHAHGEDYRIHSAGNPPHIRTMHGSCLAETFHVTGVKERLRMFILGITEFLAWRAADATVAVSQNTVRSYPWIDKVILNGVDTQAFHPGPAKDPDPALLFVGTYANRKRGKLLMELFQRDILPRVPTAKMWMVCSDAPPAPRVEVLGKLSTQDLADRFRRAWVFCLPSTYEGFGVPYIEAMASGTAVVASPNVGAKEVLQNGRYGIIASDAELSSAITRLLLTPEERQKYEALGLQRATDFDWNHIASQYEALYQDLCREYAADCHRREVSTTT